MEVTSRAHKCSFGILPEREEVRAFFPYIKPSRLYICIRIIESVELFFSFSGGERIDRADNGAAALLGRWPREVLRNCFVGIYVVYTRYSCVG